MQASPFADKQMPQKKKDISISNHPWVVYSQHCSTMRRGWSKNGRALESSWVESKILISSTFNAQIFHCYFFPVLNYIYIYIYRILYIYIYRIYKADVFNIENMAFLECSLFSDNPESGAVTAIQTSVNSDLARDEWFQRTFRTCKGFHKI